MGYYTQHSLTSDDGNASDHIAALCERHDFTAEDLEGDGTMKWFEHAEDMSAYSLEHPTVTFRLDGVGDGPADVWVEWYRNGQATGWSIDMSIPEGFVPPTPFTDSTPNSATATTG